MNDNKKHENKRMVIPTEDETNFLAFQAKWIALYAFATQFKLHERSTTLGPHAFMFSRQFLNFIIAVALLTLYVLMAGKVCLCEERILEITIRVLLAIMILNLITNVGVAIKLQKESETIARLRRK